MAPKGVANNSVESLIHVVLSPLSSLELWSFSIHEPRKPVREYPVDDQHAKEVADKASLGIHAAQEASQ